MKFTAETVKIYSRLISTYNSADHRGKEFNLTPEYLYNIMQQTHCAYSGEKFGSAKGNHPDSMTLERWDNDKGYVVGNVIPVKQKYNSMRGDSSLEQIEERALAISRRIVRAADSRKPLSAKEEARCKKIADHEKTAASIRINLHNREKHIAPYLLKKKNGTATSADLELITALQSRIDGGKSALGQLEHTISSMLASVPNKPSDADFKVEALNLIAKSLRRLEECSMLDRLKLKKGLPLTASIFQLMRGKM